MLFKSSQIAPAGRNKYGIYVSSKNITRKVTKTVYSGNDTTGNGLGNDENNQTTEPVDTAVYNIALSKTSNVFDGMVLSTTAETDNVGVYGFRDNERTFTYIGVITGETSTSITVDTDWIISGGSLNTHTFSGIPSGMVVQVHNNGTTALTIDFIASSSIGSTGGTISFPVNVIKNGMYDVDGDIWDWETAYQSGLTLSYVMEYSWSINMPATNSFTLNLTHDSAMVNCDSAGTIASAVKPSCTAKLYYGIDEVTGATYGLDYNSSQQVSGISINTNTGVLTFGNDLSFLGNELELSISANVNGSTMAGKKMKIVKTIPPDDETQPKSSLFSFSSNVVKFNPNTSGITASVTAVLLSFYGTNTPSVDSSETIYYGYNTSTPNNVYSGAIDVDYSKDYLTFGLKSGNTHYLLEYIPILKGGSSGSEGAPGRQGAAIRGPVNWWDQTTTRRFCNGQYSSDLYPEDPLWIDLILKDGAYYYCNTSYNGSSNDPWSAVSQYWTQSQNEFDFVATNLLLANNAHVDFLTNNELYLRDANNNITGGARGGTGVTFWAGSDNPNNAPFKVNYSGELSATTGHFGFMKIKQNIQRLGDGIEGSVLYTSGEQSGQTDQVLMSPVALWYENKNSSGDTARELIIGASEAYHDYDEAMIYINPSASDYPVTAITSTAITGQSQFMLDTRIAIKSSGRTVSRQFIVRRPDVPSYNTGDIMSPIFTPGLFNLPMVIVIPAPTSLTSYNLSNYISRCEYGENAGYWVFRGTNGYPTSWTYSGDTCYYFAGASGGISTGIEWRTYPFPFIAGSVTGLLSQDLMGHIGFARTTSAAVSPDQSCVFLAMQTTSATKKNHIMYIQVQ